MGGHALPRFGLIAFQGKAFASRCMRLGKARGIYMAQNPIRSNLTKEYD